MGSLCEAASDALQISFCVGNKGNMAVKEKVVDQLLKGLRVSM